MTWGLFGIIAAAGLAVAWYLKAHGKIDGIAYEVPGDIGKPLFLPEDTVHMAGVPQVIYLYLPNETQGGPANLGGGWQMAPAPYWVSVTLDGVPVDLTQSSYPAPLAIPLTKPSGKIVATYKVSAALGIIPLQGVIPDTTFTLHYEP